MNEETTKHHYYISPEQYERLYKEKKILESKTKYLIPYCFECGAEYEDQSCCPDKLISYIHPSFLKELKEKKFGVQEFRA